MSKKASADLVSLDDISAEAMTAFVTPITKEDIAKTAIERLVTLDAGQKVVGTYLGLGPTVELTDTMTGEVRDVATHRIQVAPNVTIRLIESYQLKRELPQHKDKKVVVMKLGQVNTRMGKRVNDWVVSAVA